MRCVSRLLLLLVVLFYGCDDNFPPGPTNDGSQYDYRTADWRLASFEDLTKGTVERVGDSVAIGIGFRVDGTFHGYTDCNVYGGECRAVGDSMAMLKIWTGKTVCLRANRFENPYLEALPGVSRYRATVDSLRLYYDGGRKVLNFVRLTTPLRQARLVYIRASATSFNQGYLMSSNLDGSDPRMLDSNAALVSPPRRGTIAYTVHDVIGDGIVVSGIDGSNRVARYSVLTTGGNWVVLSPDGLHTAFNFSDIGGYIGTSLGISDVDGGNAVSVTEEISQDALPAFSPDGRKLAFVGNDDRLYVVSLDGSSAPMVLAEDVARVTPYVSQPLLSWSPDSRRIAYMARSRSAVPYNPVIVVVGIDGTGRRKLTADTSESYFPAWSPDGAWIAFSCNGRLCRVSASGSGSQEELFSATDRYVLYPEWADDGGRILMVLPVGMIGPATYGRIAGDLVVFDLKTGVATTVAEDVYTGFWAY